MRPLANPGPRFTNPRVLRLRPRDPKNVRHFITQLIQSSPQATPGFHTGVVAVLGRTNVGKSSLLNALVGSKISIVTPKPQTTRHPVHGVVHRPEGQIVFVDTPGFFRTRKSQRVEQLHQRARAALEGTDAVLHVVDPSRPAGQEDLMALEVLGSVDRPKVLCINKSDLRQRPHLEHWFARRASYAALVETSARTGRGLEALVAALIPRLPVGPPLYPESEVSNMGQDFRIAEIIREKVFLLTEAEVPYRTEIELDGVKTRKSKNGADLTHVKAAILVSAERYKGMLIGQNGRKIRDIGVAARRDLETLLGQQVFLDLAVLVDKKIHG